MSRPTKAEKSLTMLVLRAADDGQNGTPLPYFSEEFGAATRYYVMGYGWGFVKRKAGQKPTADVEEAKAGIRRVEGLKALMREPRTGGGAA